VTPEYSGIGGVWGTIADAEKRYPELHKRVNKGSFFCYSDGKSITAQQIGDGSLHVSVVWVRPVDWAEVNKLGASDHARLHDHALKEFTDWDPRITVLFEAVDGDSLLNRNLYMLPVGTKWQHKRGITLIGDAAHLMTPYAGEGVNLAMADSQKLAHVIIKSTKSTTTSTNTSQVDALSSAVRTFEEDMFKRATQSQQITLAMMNSVFFTPGAPYTSIEKIMYTALSDGIPAGTGPLVRALLKGYFGIRKKFFLKPEPQ
jgi:2-polyprenyl-6-methoxyphenol hydroxylase-like FAD-dependent oxidoreductase